MVELPLGNKVVARNEGFVGGKVVVGIGVVIEVGNEVFLEGDERGCDSVIELLMLAGILVVVGVREGSLEHWAEGFIIIIPKLF